MDVFNILSYINKVSLLAFFITTLVVAYQIYVLKKEKIKEKTPSIPDFKESVNLNIVANYTSLPSSFMEKEVKSVNYSKLILITISLLTIIVIIVVASLISKNNSDKNLELTNSQYVNVAPSPILKITPTVAVTLTPTTTTTVVPSPVVVQEETPTIEPTEIVLAKNPTITSSANPTANTSVPQVLPETGSWEKGLLMIGVAISTIFFSFWL